MRILHMIPDIGISNGIMSVILNYAKAMPDDIKFDVVYFSESKENKQAEIEALGGRVFKINPPSPKTALKGEMDKFFAAHKGEWEALHINAPHFAVFIAPAARRAGIKKICLHCHSTWYSFKDSNKKRNKLFFDMGKGLADKKFACGRDAGLFWYKDESEFTVLPNAIDTEKFRYNETARRIKREELGVTDKFVVGHLGRVSPPQKNHEFLIKIFAEIKKKKDNAVLLLAGAEENEELSALAKELDISDDVRFLGNRKDVHELLQAYDIFIFPSFWEGLPVSVVEAQAAGLPVLMSDAITDEVVICDSTVMLPLDDTAENWAATALSLVTNDREAAFKLLNCSQWNIYNSANTLANYYIS